MKKTYLFILCTGLVLAGCTSKEQDEKIKVFWGNQLFDVMMKASAKNPAMLQKNMPLSVVQSASVRPQHVMSDKTNHMTGNISTVNTHGNVTTQNASKTPQVQVLDVTTEEDILPGKAPYAERVRMTSALGHVQENNQAILKDLQSTFGEEVKNSAFYITLDTERKLKKEAATALNYKAYVARQTQILAEQDKAIKQLMQQNKSSLRRIKNTPAVN